MNKEKIIIELEKQINERRNEIKDEKKCIHCLRIFNGLYLWVKRGYSFN